MLRVPISSAIFIGLIAEHLILWTPPAHGWSQEFSVIGCLGVSLVVFGLCVRSWAAGVLPKGVDLATTGPYSLCRHPLYLGSFAMMAGFCTLIGSIHDYLVMFGPIVAIYYLTMQVEERRMEAVYGARWKTYASAVPAFIPWKPHAFRIGMWTAARWLKCREYRAVAAALAGLIALEAWRAYAGLTLTK